MFAKLKKKVEDLEGSDLHKLANSLTTSNLMTEKTFSLGSLKSSQENIAGTEHSRNGSTTSLSYSGASKLDDLEVKKIENKWKQKTLELENEWKVKVIMQEHEKQELIKDRNGLLQQKKQLEMELKEYKSINDFILFYACSVSSEFEFLYY